jgi:predicted dehydrogenase
MNRRQFTKASALAFAASRLPSVAQQPAGERPIGFAAVGLGSISDTFMRACATSQSAKITALVTGHPKEKGSRYAAMYGIPSSSIYTYEQYDRLAENKQVDAVYIGLPNSMHCEYTVRAARMGKHVLCEKPMAISSAESRTMIQECHAAKVKLMIAYRVHYDPTWQQAMQIIESGGIGDIQSFQGGFFNQQPAGAWRLSRELGGGGSVLDLGIYPLNAVRHITREEPSSYTAIVSTRDFSGRFAEVEQSVEWTMKLPSGIIASCGCSYDQRR